MKQFPVILHVPHSAVAVPAEIRTKLRLSDAELESELIRITDWYTDTLFGTDGFAGRSVVYPVSRLVVDPERFESDRDEPMATVGMGAVYVSTSQGDALRSAPSVAERAELLDAFYHPHHETLTELVDSFLSAFECALIIDCHSFPSRPLPYELDPSAERPDICLGTDSFHTPDALLHLTERAFVDRGYSVAVNRPFAGAMVSSKHFRKDSRVSAIMIEVNRRLYLDEETGDRNGSFDVVAGSIREVIEVVSTQASTGRF